MEGITKFLKKLESQSLKNTFLIIFAWIFIRVFFEGIFEAAHTIGYLPFSYKAIVLYFIHYPSFYLSLFLLLVIITSLINGLKIDDVTKTFSFGFGIIILVPLIDWIIGGGYALHNRIRRFSWPADNLFPDLFDDFALSLFKKKKNLIIDTYLLHHLFYHHHIRRFAYDHRS